MRGVVLGLPLGGEVSLITPTTVITTTTTFPSERSRRVVRSVGQYVEYDIIVVRSAIIRGLVLPVHVHNYF